MADAETYTSLMQNLAHWEWELTAEAVTILLGYPLARWRSRKATEAIVTKAVTEAVAELHRVLDEEHGHEH